MKAEELKQKAFFMKHPHGELYIFTKEELEQYATEVSREERKQHAIEFMQYNEELSYEDIHVWYLDFLYDYDNWIKDKTNE